MFVKKGIASPFMLGILGACVPCRYSRLGYKYSVLRSIPVYTLIIIGRSFCLAPGLPRSYSQEQDQKKPVIGSGVCVRE